MKLLIKMLLNVKVNLYNSLSVTLKSLNFWFDKALIGEV